MKDQEFIGSWTLVKWTVESRDGKKSAPFGEDAVGLISYDSNGNMSVQIMKNNRGKFDSEDPLQGRPEEVVQAFNGFIAYCGKYKVNQAGKEVVHQIKISSFPNWVGQDQIRKFQFDKNQLTLSTDFIGSNKHTLVWNKMDF